MPKINGHEVPEEFMLVREELAAFAIGDNDNREAALKNLETLESYFTTLSADEIDSDHKISRLVGLVRRKLGLGYLPGDYNSDDQVEKACREITAALGPLDQDSKRRVMRNIRHAYTLPVEERQAYIDSLKNLGSAVTQDIDMVNKEILSGGYDPQIRTAAANERRIQKEFKAFDEGLAGKISLHGMETDELLNRRGDLIDEKKDIEASIKTLDQRRAELLNTAKGQWPMSNVNPGGLDWPGHRMSPGPASPLGHLTDYGVHKAKPQDFFDVDAFMATVKRFIHGQTYFENFMNLIGMDRNAQMKSAQRRFWGLHKSTGMNHDQVMAIRPKLVAEAHPFFVSGDMIETLGSDIFPTPQAEKNFMIDQPFKTVWMERTDGGPLFLLQYSEMLQDKPAWIVGILCHERAGDYFAEALLVHPANDKMPVFNISTVVINPATAFGRISDSGGPADMPKFEKATMVETAVHDILHWTFKRFRKECAFANEKITPIRQRVGTGKDRTAIKINKIVRVMLKSERKVYEKRIGRAVDWTHKWEVMGHWRKVDGIGKDRDGNYTIRGQTWVIPHVKGKGDIVKKQRIVIGEKEQHGQV